MHGRRRRIASALGVAAVTPMIALACTAGALGATTRLVDIPGPDGAPPFASPAGHGPTAVASPPGDDAHVFVTTQDGYVYVIDHGVTRAQPFLDIHTRTDTHLLEGLFDIAFDPDYAHNGIFYVNHSNLKHPGTNDEDLVVEAYRRSARDPDIADPTPLATILTVPWTGCTTMTTQHYGGTMTFGPDGDLYISVGDGGDGCNDSYNAVDLHNLHGKVLRVQPRPDGSGAVAAHRFYDVPADNPLVGSGDALDRAEIWAYGLRNPWRLSIDTGSGGTPRLIVGDVGNATWEEIDVVPLVHAARPPFLGWPCREGGPAPGHGTIFDDPCRTIDGRTVADPAIDPVFSYRHTKPGCVALTGGIVVHDASVPALDGRYLWSYWCAEGSDAHRLWTADLGAPAFAAVDSGPGLTTAYGPTGFGADACGHPYALEASGGGLWRLEGDTPGACGEFATPVAAFTADSPEGTIGTATATVTVTSSVAGATFGCALDGAPVACTATDARRDAGAATLTGMTNGRHTFTATATDEAGHRSAVATRAWTVDAPTPPPTTIASTATDTPAQPSPAPAPLPLQAQAPAAAPAATFALADRRVRLGRDGRLAIRLRAPSATMASSIEVSDHGLAVGRATIVLRRGAALTAYVRLSAFERRLIVRRGERRLRVVLRVAGSAARAVRALTVLAPRATAPPRT